MAPHRKKQKLTHPNNAFFLIRDPIVQCLENELIMENILQNLTTSEKGAAARVCTRWRTLLNKARLWRKCTASINIVAVDMRVTAKNLRQRDITRLHLTPTYIPSSYDLLRANEKFIVLMSHLAISIKRLNIGVNLEEAVLEKAFTTETLSSLESLSFESAYNYRKDTLHKIAQNCPNLQQLGLPNCPHLTSGTIIFMGQQLRHLTNLDVSHSSCISDVEVQQISAQMGKLEYLNISGSWVTNLGVQHLTRLPNLKALTMSSCHEINTDIIEILNNSGISLKRLNITECLRIDSNQALSVLGASRLRLKSLSLGYKDERKTEMEFLPPDVSVEGMLNFIRNGAGNDLTHLTISGGADLSQQTLAEVMEKCPIDEFYINNKDIYFQAIRALEEMLTQITEFNKKWTS